jgi:capsular exopolysaccharide synthesis family protein
LRDFVNKLRGALTFFRRYGILKTARRHFWPIARRFCDFFIIIILSEVFMPHIISFANQKGGVGKTTSAVNIAACVAALGHPTLLIDLDPQGNSSSGVGVNKKKIKHSMYEVILGECTLADAIQKTPYVNLSVAPATISLAASEFELIGMDNREAALKNQLEALGDAYEYVFIDCPPIDIVADTQIIAEYADRTIFVVRAGLLDRAMLYELEDIYKEKRLKGLAMILNGTYTSQGRYGHRYGYSYSYGYGYGYGYGYYHQK